MRHLFLLLALLGPSAASCSHGPQRMHQRDIAFELSSESVEVPMRLLDGRILIDVLLDGKGPFPFIFDTGAQGSVMDLEFARTEGLTMGQEIMVSSPGGKGRPGNQVTIDRLEIGGLTLQNVTSIAFDGLPFPRTATSPRGVLSPYGLNGLLVTLDYPSERIKFSRGALPEPDQQEVFGWNRMRGLPEIPVTVAGEVILVHLDSGASGGLRLSPALADRLPLAGPLFDMGYDKLVGQVRPARGGVLGGTVTIGRYTLENPTLRFVELGSRIGNVGAAVLRQFAITLDPGNARLRLAGPADGLLSVRDERKPRYGIQFKGVEANPLEVTLVDAASPAATAGLRSGDQILRINGRPVEAVSLDDRLEALKQSSLEVTVRRGGETLELTMALAAAAN